MGASKDPVWDYLTPGTRPKFFKCTFCQQELYGNPTVIKRHMVGPKCDPPAEVRRILLRKLSSYKRKAGADTCDMGLAGMVAGAATTESTDKRARKGTSLGSAAGPSTSTTGPLASFVQVLSSKQVEILDALCAKWIYRNALPLLTTESPSFRAFTRALNPAYKPPSRWSVAGPLLNKEFKNLSLLVESFIQRCVRDGTIVVGGDGWSDRLMNSVYNMLLFVPQPLYVETKVWGESRHTAENTAAFFSARIDALGPRNVFAFVSDTENQMKAVWDLLRYPWMVKIPCAAHCLDLLFADICKHPCVSRPLAFCGSMTRYWRLHGFPKAVLERCQQAEYGRVVQLQRPGATRWKSQLTAATALLETQGAMEKAVVDTAFKAECLLKGSVEQRKAAADVSQAVKREGNWDELNMIVKLLEPLSVALDVGQSDGRCLGLVRSALFRLHQHFSSFDFPASSERLLFRQHVLKSLQERKTYTLRPGHTLAYLLDPRYIDRSDQPDAPEMSSAFSLLKALAASHDTKLALATHGCNDDADLPSTNKRATFEAILSEYTAFRSKAVGNLVLEEAWDASTVVNPHQWWLPCGSAVPHLQTVAVKIMRMPVGFAAWERSFSNAAHIQSKLRTRLSYETLHKLLYMYFNSRVLPEEPACTAGNVAAAGGASTDVELEAIELDGANDGPVDVKEEELGMGAVAELLAANLDDGDGNDFALDETQQDGEFQPATQQSTTP